MKKKLLLFAFLGLILGGCASQRCLCIDELIMSNTRQMELLVELDKLETEIYRMDRTSVCRVVH